MLEYRFDKDAGDKVLDRSGKANNASAPGVPVVAGRDGHKARHSTAQPDRRRQIEKSVALCPPGWTVADTFKADKPDGVLLAHGGATTGIACIQEGRPAWTVKTANRASTIVGSQPLGEAGTR